MRWLCGKSSIWIGQWIAGMLNGPEANPMNILGVLRCERDTSVAILQNNLHLSASWSKTQITTLAITEPWHKVIRTIKP